MSKKLIVILATIIVHGIVALAAMKGLNLSPEEQLTLLGIISGCLSLVVSVYLHSQGKVDIATGGLTSGSIPRKIKDALALLMQEGENDNAGKPQS